jgi:ABC-type tungstate transport system substrate-binding protein
MFFLVGNQLAEVLAFVDGRCRRAVFAGLDTLCSMRVSHVWLFLFSSLAFRK